MACRRQGVDYVANQLVTSRFVFSGQLFTALADYEKTMTPRVPKLAGGPRRLGSAIGTSPLPAAPARPCDTYAPGPLLARMAGPLGSGAPHAAGRFAPTASQAVGSQSALPVRRREPRCRLQIQGSTLFLHGTISAADVPYLVGRISASQRTEIRIGLHRYDAIEGLAPVMALLAGLRPQLQPAQHVSLELGGNYHRMTLLLHRPDGRGVRVTEVHPGYAPFRTVAAVLVAFQKAHGHFPALRFTVPNDWPRLLLKSVERRFRLERKDLRAMAQRFREIHGRHAKSQPLLDSDRRYLDKADAWLQQWNTGWDHIRYVFEWIGLQAEAANVAGTGVFRDLMNLALDDLIERLRFYNGLCSMRNALATGATDSAEQWHALVEGYCPSAYSAIRAGLIMASTHVVRNGVAIQWGDRTKGAHHALLGNPTAAKTLTHVITVLARVIPALRATESNAPPQIVPRIVPRIVIAATRVKGGCEVTVGTQSFSPLGSGPSLLRAAEPSPPLLAVVERLLSVRGWRMEYRRSAPGHDVQYRFVIPAKEIAWPPRTSRARSFEGV